MNAVRIHENKLQAAVSSQYVNVQSYLDMLVHLASSVAEPASKLSEVSSIEVFSASKVSPVP